MSARKVYNFIPVPIRYTDAMPVDVGGRSILWWVEIRPKYREDEGIHRHELEPTRQFWTAPFLHNLLYRFIRRYRLWSEVRAYRIQMQFPDAQDGYLTLEGAAGRLMVPRYRLNLTASQAIEALQ